MIKNELSVTDLKKSDFYYDLPKELIAQTPVEPRDSSRLLVLSKETGRIEHRVFRDITDYLHEGDVLVVNDSKVIPARLYGVKAGTGADVETVLLRPRGLDVWEVLVRPGRRLKPGAEVVFGGGLLTGTVTGVIEDGNRLMRFSCSGEQFYSLLDRIGQMPLPPYITEKLADGSRYQTVYAKERGSAAAPTAGLHFTERLLSEIRAKGVKIVPVMLHVGLGTFRPVKEDKIADHVMHSEFFTVTEEAAEAINSRKGRLFTVGTTTCRTLESAADENGIVHPMSDDTGIFIYPGYRFKVTDALITNFHLPESTLIMLVSALAGRDRILSAYREATELRYRFFSFGDAMLII
ncbi:MAG: tRNA preQ1(34) S-adenosylmethionine ribosyltransferase-isomerase QueA [Clostridia bacterium]|nr:tRNA preQ1(34) S-adenosylmethionine ribosyltransferase-isomerase QueA [Clostridia bacterium]